jgi:hypothetical protein
MTIKLWWRRAGLATVAAAVGVAGILGPQTTATTRLGAISEVAGYATVTAADTITSSAMLARGVSKVL